MGDDVFGEDPTVNTLQEKVAKLLKKEAPLFVCSGTMANQFAIRAHTDHGDEVIIERDLASSLTGSIGSGRCLVAGCAREVLLPLPESMPSITIPIG